MPLSSSDEPAVEIIVQLHETADPSDGSAMRTVRDRTQVTLEPLHPGSTDPELARYAIARVARSSVEPVVGLLLGCAEVDAAYAKPGDALP